LPLKLETPREKSVGNVGGIGTKKPEILFFIKHMLLENF
jgi:hypothetical protein